MPTLRPAIKSSLCRLGARQALRSSGSYTSGLSSAISLNVRVPGEPRQSGSEPVRLSAQDALVIDPASQFVLAVAAYPHRFRFVGILHPESAALHTLLSAQGTGS